MNKKYKLNDLTDKEVKELRSCEDIKFVLTEHHAIHNSQQTDDFGNEITPLQYNYNVIVEILPSTEEREQKVETYITSLSPSGKDHRVDIYSREYSYLKEELGIGIYNKDYNRFTERKKVPKTLNEAVHELEDLIQ